MIAMMDTQDPTPVVREPISIRIDVDRDIIEVFGVKYSLELFRVLGFAPAGTVLKILDRDDGTVTVETLATPHQNGRPLSEPPILIPDGT